MIAFHSVILWFQGMQIEHIVIWYDIASTHQAWGQLHGVVDRYYYTVSEENMIKTLNVLYLLGIINQGEKPSIATYVHATRSVQQVPEKYVILFKYT